MSSVSVIQFKPLPCQTKSNLAQLRELCIKAAQQGAKLILLPEMCLTGYVFANPTEIFPYCEEHAGPSFQEFSKLAQELGVYLIYGFAEKENQQLYNSQNLINPDGKQIGHYRKTHLFDADLPWCMPGNLGFQSIETPLGKIGLGICMDMNFEDFIQFHIQQKTQILCVSVNWLQQGVSVLPYWAYRLGNYSGWALFANSFGKERNIEFCGQSSIFLGNHLIQACPQNGFTVLVQPLL